MTPFPARLARGLCLVTALLLLPGIAPAATTQKAPRPNIVFFMTDDHSPIPVAEPRTIEHRAFGFNGETHVYTPVIDGLARDGMIFTRAYVSSSVCSPSRYTMLSGRYAGRCEAERFMSIHPPGSMTRVENNTELEEDRPILPKLLQQAGYRTGFVGKSHVIDHDVHNFPDRWPSYGLKTYAKDADAGDPKVSAAMHHNHARWTKRIREFGFDYANGVYPANLRELFNDDLYVHNIEWTTAAALEFLEQADDQPFFLYYATTAPHGPSPHWKPDGKTYQHGLDADPHYTGEGYQKPDYPFMPSRDAIKEEVAARDKDPDHAWLRWIDAGIGAIVDKLKAQGRLENTLIVITSDHGIFRNGKTTIYEHGVRVPLAMHWPAGIKPGSVYEGLVQNIDYAPTFLELAGVEMPPDMQADGVSLRPALAGGPDPLHDSLYFELGFARGVTTKDWKYIAVRYDAWSRKRIAAGEEFIGWEGKNTKVPYYTRNSHLGYHASLQHEHYFDPDQLFYLPDDPHEKENVVEAHPEKAAEMRALLASALATFPDRPFGELTEANKPE